MVLLSSGAGPFSDGPASGVPDSTSAGLKPEEMSGLSCGAAISLLGGLECKNCTMFRRVFQASSHWTISKRVCSPASRRLSASARAGRTVPILVRRGSLPARLLAVWMLDAAAVPRTRRNRPFQVKVGTSLDEADRRLILAILPQMGGDKKKAAEVLGISLKTLYNRLNELPHRGYFLAEPHAGVDADLSLDQVELNYFKPILARMNLWIAAGTLWADGHVEYAPGTESVHLKKLAIRGVQLDYVHSAQTAAAEEAARRSDTPPRS